MRLYFRNVHKMELKYIIHSKGKLHCNRYLQEETLFVQCGVWRHHSENTINRRELENWGESRIYILGRV